MAARGATWTADRALTYVGKPLGKPGTRGTTRTNYLLLGLIAEHVGKRRSRRSSASACSVAGLTDAYVQVAEAARSACARLLLQELGSRRPARARRLASDGGAVHLGHHRGRSGRQCRVDLGRPASGRALRRPAHAAMLAQAVGDAKATAPYRPYVAYGLGVQVTRIDGHRAYGHSGRFIGVRGELRYPPGPGLAIAVLTNQNGVDLRPLTARLVSLALPKSSASPAPSPSPTP